MRHELIAISGERFVLAEPTLSEVRRLSSTNPTAALDVARRHRRQTMPDGGSVRVPIFLADSFTKLLGSPAMSTRTITLADSSTITTDERTAAVIEALQGEIAVHQAAAQGRTVTGHLTVGDAASAAMATEQRVRRAPESAYGRYIAGLGAAYRGEAARQ